MPKDKWPQKLPWGIEKTKPGSLKKITDEKLEAFSVGINKKTPFQKQQEEAALRKKKEEEEAAKVYAEFVESFDHDASKPRAWVKGGTMIPKPLFDHEDAGRPSEPGKTLYKPQPFVKAGGAPAFVKAGAAPPSVSKQFAEPTEEQREVPVPKAQRKRNLDMFLEELKKEQEERDYRLKAKQARLTGAGGDYATDSGLTLRAAFEDRPGSHDTGDPNTTNLYVGNINPAVDEEILCREFAQFGPIASVKIMWPRTIEEKDRNRNCGFVSFMTREAASNALRNLDGKELLGNALRVGWGKAVAIPAKPIYVLGSGQNTSGPSGLPFNAQLSRTQGGFGAIPPPNALSGMTQASRARLEVRVSYPSDPETVMTIHRFIERVIKHGPAFEAMIMDREKDNPKFRFLNQNDSPEHVYYRWKLYSILQGDPQNKWPTEPFQMFDDGMLWIPPEVPFDDDLEGDDVFESSDDSEASDLEGESRPKVPPKGPLLRKHRLRLEHMLRKLNLERGLIGKIMVFCIDHAHAAEEIIDVITKSLLIQATPIFPVKIARLYLLSDILHNSGTPVPNAWKYRSGFERRLEEIFAHLCVVRRGIERKLRQEQMKRAVMNLLEVWDNWIVFPAEFVDKLRQLFLEEGGFKGKIAAQQSERTGVWALDEEEERDRDKREGLQSKWSVVGGDEQIEDFKSEEKSAVQTIKFAIGKQEEQEEQQQQPIKFAIGKQEEQQQQPIKFVIGKQEAQQPKPVQTETQSRRSLQDIETTIASFREQLSAKGVHPNEVNRQVEQLRKGMMTDENSRGRVKREADAMDVDVNADARGHGRHMGRGDRREGGMIGKGEDDEIEDIFS